MLLRVRGYGRHAATTALRSSTGGGGGEHVAEMGHGSSCFYSGQALLPEPSVGTVLARSWWLPAVHRVCLSAPRYKNCPLMRD